MHYKNGRPVEVGDFVVGTSHNSEGRIIFGVVLETMPQQGPCNIRLRRIEMTTEKRANEAEKSFLRLGQIANEEMAALIAGNFEDYGDAAKFIKCEDGLRLAKAADFGRWDSPYYV